MIVRSFRLRKDNVSEVQALCSDGCIAVIRPEKPVETLFKAAIRRTIIDKKPALEEFKAIDEYFIALSDDKSYQESALEGIRNIAAYLSQAMYVQADIRSVEDYVLAKCARLLAEAVCSGVGATLVDGTELLVCRSMDGEPIIDWTLSREQIVSRLGGVSRAIVPGGYARRVNGYVVRVGRGGAHLMASLIAAALQAEVIESFIEADGVRGLDLLTYDEMAQFCADNASAISPTALWPARSANIPVIIKNLHNLSFPGTKVCAEAPITKLITGVLSDTEICLITVYGTGLPGQVGISSAIFSRLSSLGVNIRFISQTSSEYSISFAVSNDDRDKALEGLRALFEGNPMLPLDDVLVQNERAGIVNIFGRGMRNIPGVSARIYDALGAAGISVIASAQGGEQLSISLVLDEADTPRAVELLEKL